MHVQVDSSRHEIVLTAGPFRAAPAMPGHHHAMPAMQDEMYTPVYRFRWPIHGWLRGYRLELVDGRSNRLPRKLIHHLAVVNFSRRMLLYPSVERLFAIGAEGDDGMQAPKIIGVPMPRGQEIGVYAMWHNETGEEIPDVYWRLILKWTPANLYPPPVSVLPFYLDVNLRVGDDNLFDVPPGRHERAYAFTMPVSGRLLVAGGHLHDYGAALRLDDAHTGKRLVTVRGIRDRSGKLIRVSRPLLAVWGRGLKLKANHRYRLVAVYDNPTADTLVDAMALMGGIFVPDDYRRWPVLDRADSIYRHDVAGLLARSPPIQ
ncbi:MAG: hypothetical protein HY560_08070 [Gemmatimonadetes bacterium]|nr:hypothetical protein [Gemmatimonadota bacterium]